MTTLVLGNLEDALAQKLRRRAKQHGISEETEARNILHTVLAADEPEEGAEPQPKMSFAEFIVNGAPAWPDDFEIRRSKDTNEKRRIDF